ncbi:MAG: ATP-binding protein [Flavobacteriia bacterium]|nr:ATP-binding protein [Flavobacteriia bacterium]OJX36680.1 MAG: hypothetical protein BGO87_12850 [Flavobacteriia bacterium 40-80]
MVTTLFKEKVRDAVLSARENYGGSDSDFAKSIGTSAPIYSRLKKGELERILSDTQWLTIGRMMDVQLKESKWKVARTVVYEQIEDSLKFCQQNNTSMILVDDCGIGKTFCVKHVIRTMKNAFYLDCSQAKTKQQFIRTLAKTVGVESTGKYIDVKSNLKYFLNLIEMPIIALDEAGDLDYNAFLELKELWNATSGSCAWYMIGADGLRAKIRRGIQNEKVGYREIFSRFSDEFISVTPTGKHERDQFYMQLLEDVAGVNVSDKTAVRQFVTKAMKKEGTLRYLETLIKMN